MGLSLGGFGVLTGTGTGTGAKFGHGCGGGGLDFGFEDGEGARGRGGVFGLRGQIELTAARVERVVEGLQRQRQRQSHWRLPLGDGGGDGRRWKVILIGHSVGAYIALEVLRLQREKLTSAASIGDGKEGAGHFDIKAAILLTPTIVDIASSSSGKVLAPLLSAIPCLPLLVSLVARLLARVLPLGWLKMVVRTVMGGDTPEEAVMSTLSFLASRNGVRQSLEMAKDEMKEIGEDRWEAEVWGIVDAGREHLKNKGVMREPAKLVFYFADKDHWVADQTREAIIETRGDTGSPGRVKMVVAKAGELEHGWCIRHNGLVAKRVNSWVEEVIEES